MMDQTTWPLEWRRGGDFPKREQLIRESITLLIYVSILWREISL